MWAQMASHPYASAYSAMSNPFTPQTLQNAMNGGASYDPQMYANSAGGASAQSHLSDKKARMSDAQELSMHQEESEGDDDDEDDDEDEDGHDGSGKGTPANRKKGKANDGKKVKLTRGSRSEIPITLVSLLTMNRACIACRKIKMRCVPDESSGPGGPCRVSEPYPRPARS